ncbi:hypothetical protein QFZ63_001567 [Streptomyces sp. B3I7]|uniref:hypothetical protein n=1 Tax=Streptomyces sp. B3I7 TaxID=3042269 RepID=UPI0027841C82|nr:hypothetical protein [Streptomyces sp. B3I7]MDQ0809853.1 hypothetical protein [Streptomyces sp. B3I7]
MFRRNRTAEAMSPRELTARRLQQVGRTLAGERGSRIANRVSEAIGCGRIELCDNPDYPNCALIGEQQS